MPVIHNVELAWVKCNADRPVQFQGQGEFKWSVSVSTGDKNQSAAWVKEYGFKMTPYEGSDGKLRYKTSLSAYAFGRDPEDGSARKKNKAINVILMNGEPLDPDTVGNGSIGNVSFKVSDDKKTRRLVGIQVRKLVKFERSSDEDFVLSDDYEIVEQEPETSEQDPF